MNLVRSVLAVVGVSMAIGCGSKEEVNPQVTQTPTKEQLDLAAASGGDVSRPGANQASDK